MNRKNGMSSAAMPGESHKHGRNGIAHPRHIEHELMHPSVKSDKNYYYVSFVLAFTRLLCLCQGVPVTRRQSPVNPKWQWSVSLRLPVLPIIVGSEYSRTPYNRESEHMAKIRCVSYTCVLKMHLE